jgi:hypothetical protein
MPPYNIKYNPFLPRSVYMPHRKVAGWQSRHSRHGERVAWWQQRAGRWVPSPTTPLDACVLLAVRRGGKGAATVAELAERLAESTSTSLLLGPSTKPKKAR